jgi:hypothetical protein
LDDLAFNSLDAVEAFSLELSFEEREVLEVVKGMNRDKAPSLDGFSIMGVFKDFPAYSKFVKSITPTFITLILKKHGALDL